MSRFRNVVCVLACALLLALSVRAAAADEGAFVILSSTAPGSAPGQLLAAGTEVELAAGAVVVVLDRAGKLYQLAGPCTCRLPRASAVIPHQGTEASPPEPRTRGVLRRDDDLWNTALPTVRDIALGRERGTVSPSPDAEAEPGQERPDLWAMSVDASGDRCVRLGEVRLWRRHAGNAVNVDLTTRSVRQTGLTWPAGQRTMPLPRHFVVDGQRLTVRIGGERRDITLHVLPDTIDKAQWGEILIWMAARNCRSQAQFLVDGLNDGTLFPDRDRRPGLSEL